MPKIYSLSVLLFIFPFWGFSQNPDIKPAGKKGKLIWKDEFNYRGLPDSSKWAYEEGYVRNEEKQFYTRKRLENARVEKGKLVIETRKEQFDWAGYTSASINTLGKQAFEGDFRIEVKAKLPFGKGIWPAIWMMGVNRTSVGWPKCSEIDLMEFVGHVPDTVFGTMHWLDSIGGKSEKKSRGAQLKLGDLHTAYHVYGMERKGKTLKLFVDDRYYLDFTVPETAYPGSFTAPVYLLLNTAIGGTWGGKIDDRTLPQKFYIDYVRVYSLGQ